MRWQSAAISDVLLTHDSGVWGAEDVENGVSILRSTNMQNDGTIDFSKLALRAIPDEKRMAKLLKPGDILLENSGGGPKQPVGRVCYFHGDAQDHVAGNFCRRLRANHDVVLSRFLFWSLFYFHATGETERFQTQTTGIRNLQFRLYAQHELSLPPLSEQRRIVEILDQADALRKLRREADAKAARILPALFLKMFGDPSANTMSLAVEPFDRTFKDCTAGQSKVQRKDYLHSGSLAIVDQGQQPIAGYSDDLSIAYSGSLPVIVFGDHTRVFKFVDHPFALGADGIRVLSTKPPFNPVFVYWHCRLLDIPSAGYSRHFKFLREKNFLRPEPSLQSRFAYSAISISAAIERARLASERVESLFLTLLGQSLSGQLTAKWRQARMQELLVEMREQARLLNLPMPDVTAACNDGPESRGDP